MNALTKSRSFTVTAVALTFCTGGLGVATATTADAGGAPCTIKSFSIHAKLRLSQRGISEREARQGVKANCKKAHWQSKPHPWYYPSSSGFHPVMVVNKDGNAVMGWWPKVGSGGGWIAAPKVQGVN